MSEPYCETEGFDLHKRDDCFEIPPDRDSSLVPISISDSNAESDPRDEAVFENTMYSDVMDHVYIMPDSKAIDNDATGNYIGDAKVRLTAAMSPNIGHLYLFAQSLSKTPFPLHMRSVEDIRNAFTIEAFNYEGTKIEFNPPAASPQKLMKSVDNQMRAADLHEGEMIGNSIYLEELPFYKFIFLEGRLSFGEGLPVTLPIDKVVLTPNVSVFQADEDGNPVLYTGKIDVKPLVLVAGELKRLEKLFKKIGFQSVGHTMAEPLLSKDGQPLSATPKVEEEKKP